MQLLGAISHGHRGRGKDKKKEGVGRGPLFNARCLGLHRRGGWVGGGVLKRNRSKGVTFAGLLRTFVSNRKKNKRSPL